MSTITDKLAEALEIARQQAKLAADLIVQFSQDEKVKAGMCGYLDDACTAADIAAKELGKILTVYRQHTEAQAAPTVGGLNPSPLMRQCGLHADSTALASACATTPPPVEQAAQPVAPYAWVQAWELADGRKDERLFLASERPDMATVKWAVGVTVSPLYLHPQRGSEPLTEARLWELRRAAKDDYRTVEEHWFILFARAIEAAHGIRPAGGEGSGDEHH